MFVSEKSVIEAYERPEPGYFSFSSQPLVWTSCRETFATRFSMDHPSFYLSTESGKTEAVAAFISKTEDILNFDSKSLDRSLFAKTNRSYVMWVRPSDWWLSCEMRRSLFTILLRVGQHYDFIKGDYEQTLYDDPQGFIQQTKLAVMRFLFGFTKFIPDKYYINTMVQYRQWVDVFQSRSVAEVRKQLVAENDQELCLIGVGSLWN